MQLHDKVLVITGANRGIGQALVQAALKHTVKKIYAAARRPEDLPAFDDPRVVPLALDITDSASIAQAAALASDAQILMNNAGVLAFASLLTSDVELLRRDMEVNYFGTLAVTRAFVPVLEANAGGAIASISSMVGLASMAAIGGYSASKAALFSAIQAMRFELRSKNIQVFGIFPGPIDTEMSRDVDLVKASASDTAENIWAGIVVGKEDIFPDAMSTELGALWSSNPKGLELAFASL